MGTWGIESFDNDIACDWALELEESNCIRLLAESLRINESSLLDADTGICLICAAEVVYGLMVTPRTTLPSEVIDWIKKHNKINSTGLCGLCIRGLTHILGPKSELNDLWHETANYEEWRDDVTDLLRKFNRRLQCPGPRHPIPLRRTKPSASKSNPHRNPDLHLRFAWKPNDHQIIKRQRHRPDVSIR